jgi:hypothetical protein
MTYQPGIPTGNVKLNIDYSAVQTNFQQLDTQFSVDHIPFSSTTGSPPNGYHQSIHYNPQSTTVTNAPNNYTSAAQYPQGVPATTAGFGQLFSSQVNDGINVDTGLYWLSGAGRQIALTRNFVPVKANNGVTFLPGGLILQWGRQAIASAANGTTFNWPIAFTTFYSATVSVIVTANNDTRTADFLNTPSATQATVIVRNENGSQRAATVFFMAIGV